MNRRHRRGHGHGHGVVTLVQPTPTPTPTPIAAPVKAVVPVARLDTRASEQREYSRGERCAMRWLTDWTSDDSIALRVDTEIVERNWSTARAIMQAHDMPALEYAWYQGFADAIAWYLGHDTSIVPWSERVRIEQERRESEARERALAPVITTKATVDSQPPAWWNGETDSVEF